MGESPLVFAPNAFERVCSEVNSKCGSLRAAARLLPDLTRRESDEMLRLMIGEALRLAKFLEAEARRRA